MRKWFPLLILASAQFVMVLDSSVMNVAISQIVEDLDTTIQGVQTAITLYTLVMAAFMLLGAKLGDIIGRNGAFAIGLGIYGVGSLTTALSPNLAVLLAGWSGVEGFGAVLVVPAIAALTAASYAVDGRLRYCYNLLGVQRFYVGSDREIPAGTRQVRMEFDYDGPGLGKGGTVSLFVDGEQAGQGTVAATAAMIFSADDTCDVGPRGRRAGGGGLPGAERLQRSGGLGRARRRRRRRGRRSPARSGRAAARRDGPAVTASRPATRRRPSRTGGRRRSPCCPRRPRRRRA